MGFFSTIIDIFSTANATCTATKSNTNNQRNQKYADIGGAKLKPSSPSTDVITFTQEKTTPVKTENSKEINDAIKEILYRFGGDTLRERVKELRQKLTYVEDKEILDYVTDKLTKIKSENFWTTFNEIDRLTDGVNSFEGNYTSYKWSKYANEASMINKFSKYLKSQGTSIEEVMNSDEPLPKTITQFTKDEIRAEIPKEKKLFGITRYMQEFPNTETSNYLYNNYYLKYLEENTYDKTTIRDVISKCKHIDKKYGVKLILPAKFDKNEFDKVSEYIDSELGLWKEHGKDKVKFPPVISFSPINYYNRDRAYCEPGYNGSLVFPRLTLERCKRALRHELTHTNDTKQGKDIPEKYNLDEIFPKPDETNNTTQEHIISSNIDYSKCKFAEDFKRIGITAKSLIQYAHNNSKEFIAVASQGDLSKCRPEFKETLIDFGMPPFRFNFS